MTQGNPSPRKTLTELDPVTLPMAASAFSSCEAAVMDANVSGREVPRATKVIAVRMSLTPREHPKTLAMSPTNIVRIPMADRDVTKRG